MPGDNELKQKKVRGGRCSTKHRKGTGTHEIIDSKTKKRERTSEESAFGESAALLAMVSETENLDREALSINPNTIRTYAAR